MKPEFFTLDSFARWIISQVLISGLRMEHQFTPFDDGGFGSIWNGYKDEKMLETMEVGKDAKECFAEISQNRKMQNGLESQMMQLDSPELQKSIEKF